MTLTQSAGLPYSPTLPEFEASPAILHNIKYLTALEAEHSRDLYLQGAMAVGQIARLLEELCADDTLEDAEENPDDGFMPAPPFEEAVCEPTFVSYKKRKSIEAWAHAVELAVNVEDEALPQAEADFDAQEDADNTYLRGAFVVGDIADLLEDLVNDFQRHPHEQTPQPESTSLLSGSLDYVPDHELALRMSNLSARLDKLEVNIGKFSSERRDALARLEREIAVEDSENEICEHLKDDCVRQAEVDALGFRISPEFASKSDCDSLPITRIWTKSTTATSGFSLYTPPESEVQPLELERIKDCFWSLV